MIRKSDPFVIAIWAAMLFGLAEGIVLSISRAFPTILAPYKVSLHVLWIAPTFDILLFLLAGVGIFLLIRLVRKRLAGLELACVYGFFLGFGFLTVITAPKLIHPIGAVLLALGLTGACWRALRGLERPLTDALRRRLVWIPVSLVMIGAGVVSYEQWRESSLFHQLPTPSADAPNVLIVVLDTVRYDSFSSSREPTLVPNLRKMIATGVRFENAWATSSWSLPSHASILTGRYPHEHGADWPHLHLSEAYPTLAEFFAKQGYVTGAFSGNSAWVTPEYLGRGFLRFDVYILEDILRRTVLGRKIDRLLWEVGYHYAGRGKKAPQLNTQFLDFLDDYQERPFFAYLCYMDVNQVFHDHWLNYGWRQEAPLHEVFEAYERGLHGLDRDLGNLFAELQQRAILDNTLVIITSDHGQSFGAEGTAGYDHDPLGHGTSLYPEQVKVPLFVLFPKKIPAGHQITRHVSLRNIPITITHLLGFDTSPFVGESLLMDNETAQQNGHGAILTTLNYAHHNLRSVIWNRWLYIKDLDDQDSRGELYDLEDDPFAKIVLPSTHPAHDLSQEFLKNLLGIESKSSMNINDGKELVH